MKSSLLAAFFLPKGYKTINLDVMDFSKIL